MLAAWCSSSSNSVGRRANLVDNAQHSRPSGRRQKSRFHATASVQSVRFYLCVRRLARTGSGAGSQLAFVRDYIVFLEKFVRYNNIQSVVDFGCGDWAFSKYIDWGGATYLGIDCVASVVAKNSAQYANAQTQFKLVEFGDYSIPPCDLLIAKDVLQHLPFAAIHRFLAAVHASNIRFALLTNDWAAANENDTAPGSYRPVNVSMPPFNEKGATVLSFGRKVDDKVVFLLQR